MAYSGTSRPGHLTPPLKSPTRVNTAPVYNQTQKLPLVLPNKPPVLPNKPLVLPNKPPVPVSQSGQQIRERSMTGEMKRKVKLVWRKQQDTIDNFVTYFDNLDSPVELLWVKSSAHYSATADLTCGLHVGCLALSDSDSTSETQNFLVQEDSLQIQSIQLSIKSVEVKGREGQQPTNPKLGEKKREGEEQRQMREERNKLQKDNILLSSQLEGQKREYDSQLDVYKTEIMKLREELDKEKKSRAQVEEISAGERNQARITELGLESQLRNIQPLRLDEDGKNAIWKQLESAGLNNQVANSQTQKQSNYINFEPKEQFSECYFEYKELKQSKLTLSKEKQKSEKENAKFLDLLHGEKIALTQELSQTKKQLMDSEKEITRLRQALSEATVKPPLPLRSQKDVSPFSHTNHYKSSA